MDAAPLSPARFAPVEYDNATRAIPGWRPRETTNCGRKPLTADQAHLRPCPPGSGRRGLRRKSNPAALATISLAMGAASRKSGLIIGPAAAGHRELFANLRR